MQKSVIFVKKSLKINDLRDGNNYGNNCHYTGVYIGATHSMWNLKYSVPKKNFYRFS